MNTPLRDRTVALAGIFQAASVTRQLAREGQCDEDDMDVLMRSLLVIDAIDAVAIFGGTRGLRTGLELVLRRQSTQADITNFEIARYVLSLSQLASRLGNENAVIEQIGMRLKGVESVEAPVEAFSGESSRDRRFAALADIYSDTISKLSPQIVVHGERGHLGDPQIVDKVRTALFAGVRAAWLWQQVGGRKWHLVLSKSAYARMAEQLLTSGLDANGDVESSPHAPSANDSGEDTSKDTRNDTSDDTSDESVVAPASDTASDDDSQEDDDSKSRASNVTNINRRP